MPILIAILIILVVLALALYAIPLVIPAGTPQNLIKAVVIIIALLMILQRAGLLR